MATPWQSGWGEFEMLVSYLKSQLDEYRADKPPQNAISANMFDGLRSHLEQTERTAQAWQAFADNAEIEAALTDEQEYLGKVEADLAAASVGKAGAEKAFRDEWVAFFNAEAALDEKLKGNL